MSRWRDCSQLLQRRRPECSLRFEICVPEKLVTKAATFLFDTGLIESEEEIQQYEYYNEDKCGCTRLRSSSWISPTSNITIMPDNIYSLKPSTEDVISHENIPASECSSQMLDILPTSEITSLHTPQLPPLLNGLCQRYLDLYDNIAMIAAEQLVDGMDLDELWCERNLGIQAKSLSTSTQIGSCENVTY